MPETLDIQIDNTAIAALIKTRREEYLRSPLRIVEDYNNENKNIDEYNGRQLLEMIQNANDESDTNKPKKVFIKLDEETLLIANNGNPFSLGGVESLMYSDLSPKTMEENKVGKKGLGFRSILNWSKEIYIASYDLHLKFSQQHAEEFLESLLTEKPAIKDELKRKTRDTIPISVLRCPYLETDTSKKKAKEYDTVIELSLKENIYQRVIEQIDKDIVPEFLIFLNKLEEVEVQTPESHFSFAKKVIDDNKKVLIVKTDFLNPENNEEWTWNILEDIGQIEGEKETKNYELKIAYNPNNHINSHKLFSYFRTDVDFPYPVIAHGSFELKSDRNQLTRDENDFNIRLIEKLAKLLVDCAMKLTEAEDANYNALKLLIPTDRKHTSLYESPWNFNDLINQYIEEAQIFPTIENKYIALNEGIKFYEVPIQNLMFKKAHHLFKSLLKECSDQEVISYLRDLKVDLKYSDSEFTTKVNQLIDNKLLTKNQRVDWIYFVTNRTRDLYTNHSPRLPFLLTNAEGEKISSFDTVIIPPKEVTYKLPKGINLQFLNQDLFRNIRSRFIGYSTRQIIDKLRSYNVAEYAMVVVAQKIISSTHEIINNTKRDRRLAIAGMHNALYSIYCGLDENTEAKNTFPSNLTSPYLFTRNNQLAEANTLYFGNEYEFGYLMEDLLKAVEEDVFVGSLQQNGLVQGEEQETESENHSFEKYLKWLGVADFPKTKTKEISAYYFSENDFLTKVITSIKYPFTTPDYNEKIENVAEMETCSSFNCKVLWYEHFEDIVKGASFEYLLTWFIKDLELNNSLESNREFAGSVFRFAYPRKQYYRQIPKSEIKSYIYYILQKTPFIPVEDGEKSIPNNCLLDSNNLSPLVKTPKINYTATPLIKNNIDEEQINYFLKRIGLKDNLNDLSLQALYQLLNQHNTHYLNAPENIQSFYTAIIEATKNRDVIEDNIEKAKYFETGEIYSFFEGKNGFVPVHEATYVDNPNFSQDLLRKLNVAKLPPRSGNQRMQNLFGIQPLDYIKFSVQSSVESNNRLNEVFVGELNDIKPHLYAFRYKKGIKKSQLKSELSAIKNIKIRTAYNLDVDYTLNKVKYNLSLNKYEYIQDEVSKIYYIKLDREDADYQELKKDFRFKETVADIIGGALKVSENRKDFILLLGESASTWFHLMNREFENYQDLEKEILGKFDGILSSEQRFWKSILDLRKVPISSEADLNIDFIYYSLFQEMSKDEFFEVYRNLNYNNLSDWKNFPSIQKVFSFIDIDLHDFNTMGYKILNFESYLENRLHTFHKDFADKYASFLFKTNQSNDFLQRCEIISKFNSFKASNSVNFDIQSIHKQTILNNFSELNYQDIIDTEKIDLETIYKKNLNILETELRRASNFSESIYNDSRYDQSFRNAIYFKQLRHLKKDLLEQFNVLNKKEKELKINIGSNSIGISNNNFTEVLSAIEKEVQTKDYKLEFYDPIKSPAPAKHDRGNSPTRQSTYGKSKEYKNEDIGFIGEKYAFELLKKQFDSVKWVSEYAIKAGFPNGSDGLGYDFEYRDGDETRFVEVKSSVTNSYAFNISTKEVETGHSKEKLFDILVITNVLSEDVNFKYLKSIFDYKNNESFLENSKFLVENDNYKIKFK